MCVLTHKWVYAGNGLVGLYLHGGGSVLPRAVAAGLPLREEGGHTVISAPGGYDFYISHQQPITGAGSLAAVVMLSIVFSSPCFNSLFRLIVLIVPTDVFMLASVTS